jgi:phosphate transport system substrate-binding protein
MLKLSGELTAAPETAPKGRLQRGETAVHIAKRVSGHLPSHTAGVSLGADAVRTIPGLTGGNKQMMSARKRLGGMLLLGAMLIVVGVLPAVATVPSVPPNTGVSIWTGNVTAFRRKHGAAGRYTKRWDLSQLPNYVPKRQLSGTLRIWGLSYLEDGPLGKYWADAFERYQPRLKIVYHVPTGAIAVAALATGVADIGVNYKATLTDRLDFEQVYHHPVTEVTVATGSYDVYGWDPAGIVVVNKDNPLTRISIKQLDGVFGSARTGGYQGAVWHSESPYSRNATENVRTWGQLGLTGEWADKPIHVCGQNLLSGAMYQFSNEVLGGSMQFVGGYKAYTNYMTTGGDVYTWSEQVRHVVEQDPYAICYASPLTLSSGMRALAIQPRDGGPYVPRSLETVRDNTYPLTHHVYFYFNRDPGKPVDPRIEEFLRFVLSRQGQALIEREGRFLPLTAQMVQTQLGKLQ